MANTPSALSPPISRSRLLVPMPTWSALIPLTNEGNPMSRASPMIAQSGWKYACSVRIWCVKRKAGHDAA
jgi:hypothetical protein